MARLGAAALLILASRCAAQRFSCAPAEDSQSKGLKVVLGPHVNRDWCQEMEETKTVDKLVTSCAAFCGTGNIPLLVGIPSVGFSQADIEQVCLNDNSTFARYDPAPMQNCQVWSGALRLLKLRASEFVAALEGVTLAQLQFRAAISNNARTLSDVMSSKETREAMMSANSDYEVLAQYKQRLKAGLEDFSSGGRARSDLQDTLDLLRVAGQNLHAAMRQMLPQLKNFVEQCGDILIAVGSSDEYLLDICNQRGSNCIQSPSAMHVGCCCGAVPLSGSMRIGGEMGGNQTAGSGAVRRLAAAAPAPAEEGLAPLDVCAEAEQLGSTARAQRERDLRATAPGAKLLDEFRLARSNEYSFYKQGGACPSARRLGPEAGGRRPAAAAVRKEGEEREGEEREQDEEKGLAPGPRQLGLIGCSPQKSAANLPGEVVRAAFWKGTESEYCDKLPPPPNKTSMDNKGLTDICQSFCGPDAVALLVGGVSFGFNQSDMDGVCLVSDFVQMNSSMVRRCHANAQSLQVVQVSTAAFVASLLVLEAEKVRFQAVAQKTVGDLKKAISSRAGKVIEDALTGRKTEALAELIREQVAALGSEGTARLDISLATQRVEAGGRQLEQTLNAAFAALDALATSCNGMFTGVGPSGEYLLDVCSQTSIACMEHALGKHAGCCCAYSPIMALGKASAPASTIPGVAAPELLDTSGKTRVALRRRRRLAGSGVFDVCGESWEQSRAQVWKTENATLALRGGAELLGSARRQLQMRYPGVERFGCGDGAGTCRTSTSGTCQLFGCSSGHGPTRCISGLCVCQAGYCLDSNSVCTRQSRPVASAGQRCRFLPAAQVAALAAALAVGLW